MADEWIRLQIIHLHDEVPWVDIRAVCARCGAVLHSRRLYTRGMPNVLSLHKQAIADANQAVGHACWTQ